jgi:hypothetical protein
LDSTCGVGPAPPGTPCTNDGGKLCDASGQCVACLGPDDCPNATTNPCTPAGLYTPPPTCTAGVCAQGDKTDCALTHQVCKSNGCHPCVGDLECGPPVVGCLANQCLGGSCGTVPVQQGSTCPLPSGEGTCDIAGTCLSGKYVFVTSTHYPSGFGGWGQADDHCKTIALGAKLGGKWLSWTSDSMANNPLSSPSGRFTPSTTGPYRTLKGVVVANDWMGLTSGTLITGTGINVDENLHPLAQVDVWTGTKPNGTYAGASCGDWMTNATAIAGYIGTAGAYSGEWTQKTGLCVSEAHLYCFQQ